MSASDAGGRWGGGEDEQVVPEWPTTEYPPVEQILIEMGRQLRETNAHLARLRSSIAFIALLTLVGVAFLVLWLMGVITIEFKPLR